MKSTSEVQRQHHYPALNHSGTIYPNDPAWHTLCRGRPLSYDQWRRPWHGASWSECSLRRRGSRWGWELTRRRILRRSLGCGVPVWLRNRINRNDIHIGLWGWWFFLMCECSNLQIENIQMHGQSDEPTLRCRNYGSTATPSSSSTEAVCAEEPPDSREDVAGTLIIASLLRRTARTYYAFMFLSSSVSSSSSNENAFIPTTSSRLSIFLLRLWEMLYWHLKASCFRLMIWESCFPLFLQGCPPRFGGDDPGEVPTMLLPPTPPPSTLAWEFNASTVEYISQHCRRLQKS